MLTGEWGVGREVRGTKEEQTANRTLNTKFVEMVLTSPIFYFRYTWASLLLCCNSAVLFFRSMAAVVVTVARWWWCRSGSSRL